MVRNVILGEKALKVMTQEEKDVLGRKITDEYYADGEWHYKYTIYKKWHKKIKNKIEI